MTEDITKLPKWAQWKIKRLERDLEVAEKTIKNHEAGTGLITYQYLMGRKHGLPDGATVEFTVDNGRIDVSIDKGLLRVSTSHTIQVLPRATNTFNVVIPKDD